MSAGGQDFITINRATHQRALHDAKRYRWLRKQMRVEGNKPDCFDGWRHWCGIYSKWKNLDRTIDEAMK